MVIAGLEDELGRLRPQAEKLRAEVEKLRAEAEKLRYESSGLRMELLRVVYETIDQRKRIATTADDPRP
jgi:hypothetical protein